MQLQSPFEITPRLMVGMRIGDAWLSIGYAGQSSDGRTQYEYFVDLPCGTECHAADLRSGVGQRPGLQEMFGTLLSFLGACGESFNYAKRNGIDIEDTECGELFPHAVAEWAARNCDEISSMQFDLEESGETYIVE